MQKIIEIKAKNFSTKNQKSILADTLYYKNKEYFKIIKKHFS